MICKQKQSVLRALSQCKGTMKEQIVVGIPSMDNPPFSKACVLKSNQSTRSCSNQGIIMEVLQVLMTQMRVDFKFEPVDGVRRTMGGDKPFAQDTYAYYNHTTERWQGYAEWLLNGTVDFIAADFTPTEERLKAFEFSAPITLYPYVFLVPVDSNAKVYCLFRLWCKMQAPSIVTM